MEALYGYMTESELENSIMEKEFNIEMKRLFLESSYMTEAGNPSKKQNVFQKMITTIKEFIQKILKSMSDFMDKMKEKKIESKLKDAPPVKMDYDPRKRFAEIEKSTNSILNKLKHPGLIKKDETGTHLTSRGKKVIAGAGITVGVAVIFDVYRRINKMMKELNSQNIAIDSHQTEIKRMDRTVDRLDNDSLATMSKLDKLTFKQQRENDQMKKQITELEENVKEANELRQDLESSMKVSIDWLKRRNEFIEFSASDNAILDILLDLKKKYRLSDSELRGIKNELRLYASGGNFNKNALKGVARDYILNNIERFGTHDLNSDRIGIVQL